MNNTNNKKLKLDADEAFSVDFSTENQAGGKPVRGFMWLLAETAGHKRIILAFLLIVAAAFLVYLKQQGYLTPENVFSFLKSYPVLAPIFFILFNAASAVFLLPTVPFNLGAGFLWGPWWGSLISVAGATLGAVLPFLISRYLAGDYFRERSNHRMWVWLQSQIDRNGWKIIAFTRLNPIFPSGLINYVFGITSMTFWKYFISSMLFMTPPTVIVALVGDAIGGFVLAGEQANILKNILIACAIATALILIHIVLKNRIANPD